MHDKAKEKEKVLGILRMISQDEMKFNKQQNFERAIAIALDEVNDFERLFRLFISDVSHLEVFQQSIKEPLTRDMEKMIHNLRYLIEKNYTKEDKASMPENVLNQVRATQDKRFNLLKKVAQKYLHRPTEQN
jgi:hypothetical protein